MTYQFDPTMPTSAWLPNANEVVLSMEEKLQQFLIKEISNQDSPLYRIFDGNITFWSEAELKAHLQDALAKMWNEVAESMQSLGFPIDSRLHQTHAKRDWQEYMRRFTEGIYTLISPAIERKNGWIYIDLSNTQSLDKISLALTKQINNTRNGTPLAIGQQNSLEWAALNHVWNSLKILPKELRAYISEVWVSTPISSKNQIYREWSVMKYAKTGLMTTTLAFMTYGIHGFIGTGVTKLAESQPNQLDNIWSSLLQSSAYAPLSWGTSIVAAYAVGTALLYPAQKIRKNLITQSEKWLQASPLRAIWSSWFSALALAIPITFGVIDAAGIFNREAEGYIVWHVAYQTKEQLKKVLDIQDPNTPVGKAAAQYNRITNTLTVFWQDWLKAEDTRPWASGRGPAYAAKEFYIKWDAVLWDTKLWNDPKLQSLVQTASEALNKDFKDNHAQYPGLPDKAKRVQEFFGNRTSNLVDGYTDAKTWAMFQGISSFDKMIEMNKHGPIYHFLGQIPWLGNKIYKSHDLALMQGEFEREAKDYKSALERVNSSWIARSAIYQKYVTWVSDEADRKYNSKTSVNIPSSIPVPDLSELDNALAQKPPKISALWPSASYEQLQKITDVPGGISKWDFDTLVTFSLIRPFALEFASLSLILIGLFGMARHYRNPKNKLSGKRDVLYETYNNLVSAVHKTFSSDTWQALFPGHPGISEQDAEYIVREIAVDLHPELLDFFPSVHNQVSKWKKVLHKWVTFLKNIHQWNTRTDDESFVLALSQALEKMWTKSTGNIGINEATIGRIMNRVISAEMLKQHNFSLELLEQITQAIAENLDRVSSDKDASYAIESAQFKKQFAQRIANIDSWVETLENELIPRLNSAITDTTTNDSSKSIFSQLITRVTDLRDKIEELKSEEHPVWREITTLEIEMKKLFDIAARYRIRF